MVDHKVLLEIHIGNGGKAGNAGVGLRLGVVMSSQD